MVVNTPVDTLATLDNEICRIGDYRGVSRGDDDSTPTDVRPTVIVQ